MTIDLTLTLVPDGHALVPVLDLPADQRPALVYLAGLAPGAGRRVQRQALDVIAHALTGGACDCETCPWGALRFQHTAAIRTILAESYAPATANRMLAALRGVIKAAWRLGQMTEADRARAVDLVSVRGQALPRGRALTAGELRALFGACADDPTPAGRRDAAILAIFYGGGLRRAEAAALDIGDYDPATGALLIRSGKGRKARVAYLGSGARDALDAWLVIRGGAAGRLFGPLSQDGQPAARGGLSDQALYDVCKKRADQARVKDFSPHDLRRSFVSDLLDAGADVVSVQGLAGHANVTTTARYDRRGERARVKAAGLLHVPYEAPKTLTD